MRTVVASYGFGRLVIMLAPLWLSRSSIGSRWAVSAFEPSFLPSVRRSSLHEVCRRQISYKRLVDTHGHSHHFHRTPFVPSRLFGTYSATGPRSQTSSDGGGLPTQENWKVPDYVPIPQDRLEWSFVRSSGAGGQNVNKVNTQVQIRFHVDSAEWIGPWEVRQRLHQQQASRINKDGYLVLRVQEHRTQTQNRQTALQKLQQMIVEAYPRPVVRKKRTGLSKKTKEQRKEFKRRRSQVKESRRKVDF